MNQFESPFNENQPKSTDIRLETSRNDERHNGSLDENLSDFTDRLERDEEGEKIEGPNHNQAA